MLRIITVIVTPFQQNARLLWDTAFDGCVLIDPGGEVERILSHLPAGCQQVDSILLTHAHLDHGGGVAAALDLCEKNLGVRPKLFAHPAEEMMRQTIAHQAQLVGFSAAEYKNVPEPDEYLNDGDVFSVGSLAGRILFTPGHSPGHISLSLPNTEYSVDVIGSYNRVIERGKGSAPQLIVGDALFSGSIGRTDIPGGDYGQLISSIEDKLMPLPDNTRVLSGHGPDTTIGAERASNPFLQNSQRSI